ncbi:SUKH-4 family immunity protein [Streptomyces cynarae]|uniref:SUKH-4 family immunity protein n=1 Tax=Streptomyces cynarae TaxID=2981134 RepID=UPI00406C5B67
MAGVVHSDHDRIAAIRNGRAKDVLIEQGLPQSTLLFTAVEESADGFMTGDGREVIQIGYFDEDLCFYLDVDRGQVLFGLEGDEDPAFVNEALDGFVSCLREFDSKYPFYSASDIGEVKQAAGRDLKAGLEVVDPVCAASADSFWSSIIHDVSIGDYHEGSL